MQTTHPNPSKFLYGLNPTGLDLTLIHLGAATIALGVLTVSSSNLKTSSLPQIIVLTMLLLDLAGGVIANATQSTNRFYAEQPLLTNHLFLLAHALQPLVAVLILGMDWFTFAFLFLYMLVSSSIVLQVRNHPSQQAIAMIFLLGGLLLNMYSFAEPGLLTWFGNLYFLKLIYAFAINHHRTMESP